MNTASSTHAGSDLILINGGTDLEVTLLDGSTETVKVRQLPIKSMESYLHSFADESKVVGLFTDKSEEWAAQLTPASHTAIMEKGEEINRPFFVAWYQRRMARIELLNPGFSKNLSGIVDRAASAAIAKSESAGSDSENSASPSPSGPA